MNTLSKGCDVFAAARGSAIWPGSMLVDFPVADSAPRYVVPLRSLLSLPPLLVSLLWVLGVLWVFELLICLSWGGVL
jgi:hypothetical protein